MARDINNSLITLTSPVHQTDISLTGLSINAKLTTSTMIRHPPLLSSWWRRSRVCRTVLICKTHWTSRLPLNVAVLWSRGATPNCRPLTPRIVCDYVWFLCFCDLVVIYVLAPRMIGLTGIIILLTPTTLIILAPDPCWFRLNAAKMKNAALAWQCQATCRSVADESGRLRVAQLHICRAPGLFWRNLNWWEQQVAQHRAAVLEDMNAVLGELLLSDELVENAEAEDEKDMAWAAASSIAMQSPSHHVIFEDI